MSKPKHRRSSRFLIANIRGSAKAKAKLPQTDPVAWANTAMFVIEMEPGEPGTGFEFVNKIVGGIGARRSYIGPAENGMKETCSPGVIAGFPMN